MWWSRSNYVRRNGRRIFSFVNRNEKPYRGFQRNVNDVPPSARFVTRMRKYGAGLIFGAASGTLCIKITSAESSPPNNIAPEVKNMTESGFMIFQGSHSLSRNQTQCERQEVCSRSSMSDIVDSLGEADVLILGECHDDYAAHEIELHLLQLCHRKWGDSRRIVLSLEMFERDVQIVLNEYLRGLIRERDFLKDSRVWQNYSADYRPLVEYAKSHGIHVVAANTPRRYVSIVGTSGRGAINGISPDAAYLLPPLPYAPASTEYAAKFEEQMRALHALSAPAITKGASEKQMGEAISTKPQDNEGGCPYIGWSATKTKHMLDAQVLWDATMAHSIATAALPSPLPPQHPSSLPTTPHHAPAAANSAGGGDCGKVGGTRGGALVVHVCGKFHCEGGLGIPEHLARYANGLRVVTVVCAPAEEVAGMTAPQVARLGHFVAVTWPRPGREPVLIHPV